jgi:sec-independent protein translocase protein TatA
MGFGSIWPWLLVLAIVILLFGRGKVSGLMGDVAQGVKSFKRGLADDEQPASGSDRTIDQQTAEPMKNASNDQQRTTAS